MLDGFGTALGANWRTGAFMDLIGPSASARFASERWARYERAAYSPGRAEAIMRRSFDSDVRDLLPNISAPTLVLHRRDDRVVPIAHGRYIAEHIPGARFVELDVADNVPFLGDADAVYDEIEEFLTRRRGSRDTDRMLATVLFSDIAHSTDTAARLGDRRWAELLDDHDAMMRRQFARFDGREINTTGDGFVATFDSPARVTEFAHAGEVLATSTVRDLMTGSGVEFVDHGRHVLKGVPGEWSVLRCQSV